MAATSAPDREAALVEASHLRAALLALAGATAPSHHSGLVAALEEVAMASQYLSVVLAGVKGQRPALQEAVAPVLAAALAAAAALAQKRGQG